MTDTAITTLKNERGVGTTIRSGERMVMVFTPTTVTGHKDIGEIYSTLATVIAEAGEMYSAQMDNYSPTGLITFATKIVNERVKGSFIAARTVLADAIADNEKRTADKFVPTFTDIQTPAVRVELRNYAKTLPLPALMEIIGKDAGLVNAVVEGGQAMSGLPADIFDRIRDEMAIGNLSTKLMGQRIYRSAPSAADPVGGQPDYAAARKAAEDVINGLSAERDTLMEARGTLALAIDAVAVLTDQTRDGAFALLTA